MGCAPCVSIYQRKRALAGRPYICCGGHLPCAGRCAEGSCPDVCLCMEAFCCTPTSILVTRYQIQDDRGLQNTQCDNACMAFAACLAYVSCILDLIACCVDSGELDAVRHCMHVSVDVVWGSMCACILTQHQIELDVADKAPGHKTLPSHSPPQPVEMKR